LDCSNIRLTLTIRIASASCVAPQTPLHCYSTLSNTASKPVTSSRLELHGGLRGSGAPERPGGPRETSEGTRGSVKGPHEITYQSMIATNIIILSTDADAFCSRNVTSGGLEGASAKKNFRLAIASHILRPTHKLCYNSTTALEAVNYGRLRAGGVTYQGL